MALVKTYSNRIILTSVGLLAAVLVAGTISARQVSAGACVSTGAVNQRVTIQTI